MYVIASIVLLVKGTIPSVPIGLYLADFLCTLFLQQVFFSIYISPTKFKILSLIVFLGVVAITKLSISEVSIYQNMVVFIVLVIEVYIIIKTCNKHKPLLFEKRS